MWSAGNTSNYFRRKCQNNSWWQLLNLSILLSFDSHFFTWSNARCLLWTTSTITPLDIGLEIGDIWTNSDAFVWLGAWLWSQNTSPITPSLKVLIEADDTGTIWFTRRLNLWGLHSTLLEGAEACWLDDHEGQHHVQGWRLQRQGTPVRVWGDWVRELRR